MEHMICSWCDQEAKFADGRPSVEEEERECACLEHKPNLHQSMTLSMGLTGNPFAGEAAEGWMWEFAETEED